ncbi:MAG: amidohydrolase family protein, partial [Ruegeria sp.]
GNITGAAIETQWMQPFVDIGAWKPETMVPETIEVMQGFLSTQGVTSVLVPGLITPNFGISSQGTRDDFEAILPILADRAESGEAKMRINVVPFMKLLDADPDDYVPFAVRMREQYNSDMLRVDGLKLHADGHHAQRSMAMLEPYNMVEEDILPFTAPLTMNSDLIHETIIKATAEDLTVIVHSDGSKINDVVTGAIIASKKAYPEAASRHRLDHITFLDPDTVERIKKYDIHLNATPVFYNAVESGQDGSAILEVFNAALIERSMGMYTDLIHQDVSVSMGGDPPGSLVTEAYPIWLFQQAMTLQQPGRPDLRPFPPMRKRLTIDQALKSMTLTAATQMGMEDRIGSIEVGKYADLAVFNRNLHEVPPEDLVDTVRVLMTYLNGEQIWDGRELTEEQWNKLMKTGTL